MVIPLERLDSSSSNSPPHLEEVQIPNPPGMDNNQMCLGYQGGVGGVEASNQKVPMHFFGLFVCLFVFSFGKGNISFLIF